MKGIYCLALNLPESREIRIGRAGRKLFTAGSYVYIGRHMRSIEHRITRHYNADKVLQWHIDYFRKYAEPVMAIAAETPDKSYECWVAQALCKKFEPIIGFGNSDCKNGCPAHLVFAGDITHRKLKGKVMSVFKVLRLDPKYDFEKGGDGHGTD